MSDSTRAAGCGLLPGLVDRCLQLVVLELAEVRARPEDWLTPRERERFEALGERRRPGYLGARMALKNLCAPLGLAEAGSLPTTLETLAPDGVRPVLPGPEDGAAPFCSAAHDDRFVIAVAAKQRIGVDVERVAPRVERVARAFVTAAEAPLLADDSALRLQQLTRLWTLKEAVCKGRGIPLARAFVEVTLIRPGAGQSHFALDGREHAAHHDVIADHVFTLVGFEGEGG